MWVLIFNTKNNNKFFNRPWIALVIVLNLFRYVQRFHIEKICHRKLIEYGQEEEKKFKDTHTQFWHRSSWFQVCWRGFLNHKENYVQLNILLSKLKSLIVEKRWNIVGAETFSIIWQTQKPQCCATLSAFCLSWKITLRARVKKRAQNKTKSCTVIIQMELWCTLEATKLGKAYFLGYTYDLWLARIFWCDWLDYEEIYSFWRDLLIF